MFKKALFILLSSIICLNAYAQKEVITIKKFTKSPNVSNADLAAIRASVVAELSQSGRFDIIDEDMLSTGEEEGVLADFIVEGKVILFEATKLVIEGVTCYIGKLQYSITTIDGETKETILSENFIHPKHLFENAELTSINVEGAKRAALDEVSGDINNFIKKAFPNTGFIYGEDYEDKGDKLLTCHISIGAARGVKKGAIFKIYEVQTKVGQKIETEIGKLKVVEVYDKIAKCEIIKRYQKDVKSAFDRYLEKLMDDPKAAPLRIKSTTH